MGSSEVKVGAFALGGAVVLAGIITFMGAFSFGKGTPLQFLFLLRHLRPSPPFCVQIKMLGKYRIILSTILRSKIFRHTSQKCSSILRVLTSIFVKYDGKDLSKIALKCFHGNYAVLP